MAIRNKYGEFTDTPVEDRWFLKFECLKLRESHRKILNRQPIVRFINRTDNIVLAVFIIDPKVMSN